MQRASVKKVALFLGSLVLTLVLTEIGCRVALVVQFGSPEKMYTQIGVERQPLLGFDLFRRKSAEPLPFVKTTYSTNSLGLRDARELGPKEPGEVRIVVLGGSSAFGYGATSDETTFAAVLENDLAARFPEHRIRVLNAGTPAYVSYQVLAKLQLKVLDLEPDYLVLYLGWNDLFVSGFMEPRAKNSIMGEYQYFAMNSWQQFIVAQNREVASPLLRNLALTLFVNRAIQKPAPPGGLLPPSMVDLATDQLYDNLSSMVAIARYWQIDPLLVTLMSRADYLATQRATLNETIRRVARESGSRLVDADARVMAEHPEGVNDPVDFYHLTDDGNRYLAGLLTEELSEAIGAFSP